MGTIREFGRRKIKLNLKTGLDDLEIEDKARNASASFRIRAERILSKVFGGLHNCPKIKRHYEGTEYEMWEVNKYGDLSTFDFDDLTRLVIAAHDECVRAAVCPSAPKMLKICLYPRKGRKGRISERHPSIEEVIATSRHKE